MSSRIARIAAAATALLAALLLVVSCSESKPAEQHAAHDTDEPVITGEPAGFNEADVAFATNMIPHHQQAIDMAALVPERTTNQELITLANKISAAQQPEINALRVFLVQWNENPQDGSGGHEGHAPMMGMADEATMQQLAALSGPEFDRLWLQTMVAHHEGAVEMAMTEIAKGENVDAKRMAQNIIDTQQREIGQMNEMLEAANG